ncbi:MAG TPA: dihydrodipicolinate reductase C-terminal domain-containing protein [Candidatus Limnocylindrales bacterium]|nr:dihydrodipicolinate reductase C-terminal domain-containing protein [Candidatus Limnocylindrales bacterium]
MSTITILGDGALGHAIAHRLRERGDVVAVRGRPPSGRHELATIAGSDVVVDASRGEAVASNLTVALAAGVRRIVVATTGWDEERDRVAGAVERVGATAVVAPNLALGAALFLRLVDDAARLAASIGGFDPSVVEWHRRTKTDRPSGTAREIVRRLAAELPMTVDEVAVVRSGSMPGMHAVAFDGASETIELRLTARDRSGYAAGATAAIDWLLASPRPSGLVPFDRVVDDLIATRVAERPAA